MTKELEELFIKWWDSDNLLIDNPYAIDTPMWWAWEGYVAGVKAEREVCAKMAAWILKMPENDVSAAIRARGQS